MGVNQKADGFMSMIKDNYNEHHDHERERGKGALKAC